MHLREKALAGEAKLAKANRELWREMEAREHVQEELRHSQKMDALGQLTGGIAHDFNNLLAIILGNLRLAGDNRHDAVSLQKNLNSAIKAASRGASLTESLLTLSRKQALKPEFLDANALLANFKPTLEHALGETIQIKVNETPDLSTCIADAAQLENAILNLAINARDAMMPAGGEISISTQDVTLDEMYVADHPDASTGPHVVILVRDTGEGIPTEHLSKVFEPFFTTKPKGQGTGLGLSMVYGFARQSHGHAVINSVQGEGTEVQLYLPANDAPFQQTSEKCSTGTPLGRGEVVLVVEDDSAVRELVVTLMSDLNYRVLEAADGSEALKLFEKTPRIDLLLTDVVLPGGVSGREFSNRIAARRPEVRVLLMSGYATEILERDGPLRPDEELLRKPFSKAELARKARAILDRERRGDGLSTQSSGGHTGAII
jgi:nitrogen-specific signal transduction histidine kinase